MSVFQPLLININPKTTVAGGACGNTTATLKLNDGNSTLIAFTFIVVSNLFYFKLGFHLSGIAWWSLTVKSFCHLLVVGCSPVGSGTGKLAASRQMENWVKVVENLRPW